MSQYLLCFFQIFKGVFVEEGLQLWFPSCSLSEEFFIEALSNSENHVKAFLSIIFTFLENSPQIIGPETSMLRSKINFSYMNFFHESNEIFVNIVENGALPFTSFL